MSDKPQAVTRDHEFLAAVCDLLDRQNELLAGIRDHLTTLPVAHVVTVPAASPAAPPASDADTQQDSDGGAVELKEPAPPRRAKAPAARKAPAAKKPTPAGARGRAAATKEQT